jgi:hypothetical protein
MTRMFKMFKFMIPSLKNVKNTWGILGYSFQERGIVCSLELQLTSNCGVFLNSFSLMVL